MDVINKRARRLYYRAVQREQLPDDSDLEEKVLAGMRGSAAAMRFGVEHLRGSDFADAERRARFRLIREASQRYGSDGRAAPTQGEFKVDCRELRRLNGERVFRRLAWQVVEKAYGSEDIKTRLQDAAEIIDRMIQRLSTAPLGIQDGETKTN